MQNTTGTNDSFQPRSMTDLLTLERMSTGSFVGAGQPEQGQIFGGRLVAQALSAAGATVRDRPATSLHGNFVLAGDGSRAISYEVEQTRDGGSFSLRRVVATQEGRVLFVATACFQEAEPGVTYEVAGPAEVPGPDNLPPGRYDSPWFESRDVPEEWPYNKGQPNGDGGFVSPHTRLAWFRSRLPIADDERLRTCAVSYLSDYGATRAVRQPHASHPRVEERMSVSLSHSVWFHAPARADEWLLSELHPVATGAGRGHTIGAIRTRDGRLVASMAQEALLRLPNP
jgi:acyl-CoA thioesterase II